MSHRVDVAIIGASIAGSSLALHLAQKNISSLVTDRLAFPRQKPCGEGLSILGVREFDALGMPLYEPSIPHFAYRGFDFIDQKKRSSVELFDHQSSEPHGIGIQRSVLDNLLHKKIESTQLCTLHCGEEPHIRELHDGTFSITVHDEHYLSRYLVVATGALSKVPQDLGISTVTSNGTRCGMRVYIRTAPVKTHSGFVTILINPDFQVCCTRVREDLVNLSFMAPHQFGHRFRPAEFSELLSTVLDAFEIEGDIEGEPRGVSGIGKYSRIPRLRNIFLVGDALRQLDPIGGMGMSQALVSSRITGETIFQALASETRSQKLLASHHKRIRRALSSLRAYTSLSYWSLASTTGKRVLGNLKTGGLAREILMSMHRPPSWKTPTGVLSRVALYSASKF